MARVILHADANGFYASCELVFRPELKGLPLSVGGDQEARHGIVLASSREAKRCGIKTGMVLWQAKQLCPNLVILPPNFSRYLSFSRRLRQIYEDYSPKVESYGLDECWIDISNPDVSLEDGEKLADKLRQRARDELGLTLSVGVSWNKIFAKLGSDYKKPDATTLISPDNYKELVWPLPAGDLLFVGPRTKPKLAKYRIYTIGDIANAPDGLLSQRFGKVGRMHQCHARGLDESPVMTVGAESAIKSVGNSTTTPQDMCSLDDVCCVYTLLAESVATRLREAGLKGRCISISARDAELNGQSCQLSIDHHTALAGVIRDVAMQLFISRDYAQMLPLRSVGVSCSGLTSFYGPLQMDLMGKAASWEKQVELAKSIDQIRKRYGTQIIQRGNVLANPAFSGINPHDDHVIHPVPFYAG